MLKLLEKRKTLFKSYVKELWKLKEQELNEKQLDDMYKEYSQEPNMTWHDIYANDGIMIGFLLVCHWPNCHPDTDYYIEEAYISPEYRRQGYMSNVISKYLKENPGSYCLFILKNNKIAKEFWFKTLKKNGYKEIYLSDVGAGDEYCDQYGFTKI